MDSIGSDTTGLDVRGSPAEAAPDVANRTITARLPDKLVARLDAHARRLSSRAQGATITRTEVLRLALQRGLDALEAETGKPDSD